MFMLDKWMKENGYSHGLDPSTGMSPLTPNLRSRIAKFSSIVKSLHKNLAADMIDLF